MPILISRLKALRRNHCETCGCPRCQKIDALIMEAGEELTYPDNEEHWVFEGYLSIDDRGEIYLGRDRLQDVLARWENHQLTILVGPYLIPNPQD